MKVDNRLDVITIFIIRVLPIVISLYCALELYDAWQGLSTNEYRHILNNSGIKSICFFLISLSQSSKFHCVWNRVLWINLSAMALLQFLDVKYNLIPTAELQLIILSAMQVIAILTTIILAVIHFIKVNYKKWQNESRI